LCAVDGHVRAPWDVGGDDVLAAYVGGVIAHPQFTEAFPFVALRVP